MKMLGLLRYTHDTWIGTCISWTIYASAARVFRLFKKYQKNIMWPFPIVLCVVTGATLHRAGRTQEPGWMALVLAVEALCFVNLWLQSVPVQIWAHDAFVGVFVHATLASTCEELRFVGTVAGGLMLLTRSLYDRCVFLWWQRGRNLDSDLAITLLLILHTLRKERPLVAGVPAAVFSIVFARCMGDSAGSAVLFA